MLRFACSFPLWFSSSLTLSVCRGAVSLARSVTHPLRGGTTVFSFLLFLFPLFLFVLSVFVSCFFVGVVCLYFVCFSLSQNVYVVPVVSSIMTWHCVVYSAYCVPGITYYHV